MPPWAVAVIKTRFSIYVSDEKVYVDIRIGQARGNLRMKLLMRILWAGLLNPTAAVLCAGAGCYWRGIQGQAAAELCYRAESVTIKIVYDALVDLVADQRVIEQGSADTDAGGAGDQKFDGIFSTDDTALSDDGNVVVFADLVDLVHLQQRDGFDGRSGQAALVVADNRSALLDINRHAHQGIDDREAVATGLDTQAGIAGNIRLVR